MRIRSREDFEWDAHNINHLSRHSIEPEEAEEVLLGVNLPPHIRKTKKVRGEKRYIAFGVTAHDRYLLIVLQLKHNRRVRVITGRPMNKEQKKFYQKWLKQKGKGK